MVNSEELLNSEKTEYKRLKKTINYILRRTFLLLCFTMKKKKNIKSYFNKIFFTIVIPVYNEEKQLKETFNKLLQLNYDKKYFEIILVENGSTDDSYKIALFYEGVSNNIRVYQSAKGVSKAKNLGLKYASEKSDFTIFLDADTILEKDFLKDLNTYINKNIKSNIVIGTTSIKPSGTCFWYDRVWFKFFDIWHRLTKTSYSIQIAQTNIAKKVGYDENLNYSEDLKFINSMCSFGSFFFFNTNQISTSTRRFKKDGYFKTVFCWSFQVFTPYKYKIYKPYRTIRGTCIL